MSNGYSPDAGRPIVVFSTRKTQLEELIEYCVREEFEIYGIETYDRFKAFLRTAEKGIEIADSSGLSSALLQEIVPYVNREGHSLLVLASNTFQEEWERSLIMRSGAANGHLTVLNGDRSNHELIAGIKQYLETKQARGQRRYVRFGGEYKPNASFRFSLKGVEYAGTVHDISSVGMSCAFDKETVFNIDEYINEIQLFLDKKQFSLAGKVFQQRWLDEEKRLFVVMFDKRMPDKVRRILQDFIHSSLQAEFDKKLERSLSS